MAQTLVCEALSLEFRLQAVFALRERLPPKDGTPKQIKVCATGGELRQGAGCFTAQKFLESEGPVVCFAIGPFCISLCPPW